MALHGSLVAAVLLGHRNTAPLEGQARIWGRLLGKKCGVLPHPLGTAPTGCPLPPTVRPETGHRLVGLTRVCPSLTTRVPSGWYHTRAGRPGTSSLWRKRRVVSAASQGGTVTARGLKVGKGGGAGRKSLNLPVLPESAEGGDWVTYPSRHLSAKELSHTLAM